MSDQVVPIADVVTSAVAGQANGRPIRVGGNNFGWQIEAPAALAIIEVSNDKVTWDVLQTAGGDNTGSNTYGAGLPARVNWVRGAVAADAGGPRQFFFYFTVVKEV